MLDLNAVLARAAHLADPSLDLIGHQCRGSCLRSPSSCEAFRHRTELNGLCEADVPAMIERILELEAAILNGGQPRPATRWRVGRKLGRTLYLSDVCVGMVDTPELASEIVSTLNGCEAALDRGRATLHKAIAERGDMQARMANAVRACAWNGAHSEAVEVLSRVRVALGIVE